MYPRRMKMPECLCFEQLTIDAAHMLRNRIRCSDRSSFLSAEADRSVWPSHRDLMHGGRQFSVPSSAKQHAGPAIVQEFCGDAGVRRDDETVGPKRLDHDLGERGVIVGDDQHIDGSDEL